MKKVYLEKLGELEREELCKRSGVSDVATLDVVRPILDDVRSAGDNAVIKYSEKFDGVKLNGLELEAGAWGPAGDGIEEELKEAMKLAKRNIEKFHRAQDTGEIKVETMPGVKCFMQSRAIERVGLYIPGGTAPLFSTVLMLGTVARLAGCQEIVLCSPPPLSAPIIYAAKLVGVDRIFQVGGAQAIAAMAYGTESIPKVDKIFGPGNRYVTAAKMLVNMEGVAIDLPAGPSEVLVIADEEAKADFVAADLLSQAEHDADARAILVCTDEGKAEEILAELDLQIADLPRREIAAKALEQSFCLIARDVDEALEFSNQYAPEHLILSLRDPRSYVQRVQNAGSVFLGEYSCEAAGDYASGPNHTLPTGGYAKSYSGVCLDSFKKKISFQELSSEGARNLGSAVMLMAEAEGLLAHKKAMALRVTPNISSITS